MPICYRGGKLYELFVDNTILCFEDIDRNKDTYTSIFQNPILQAYKAIHDRYGTVFTLCVFWEVDSACVAANLITDAVYRAKVRVGWNLSNMTDKFKSEFQANSDWLKCNYHGWNTSTSYASSGRNLGEDYVQTRAEVIRFAGNDSWIDFRSKIHNYSAAISQQQQLAAQGVKVMVFSPQHTNYNGFSRTTEFQKQIYANGEAFGEDTGLLYSISSARVENVVLNNDNLGVGAPMDMYTYLTEFVSGTHEDWKETYMKYKSIETHEYCYWWDKKVLEGYMETARWMSEHGYRPGFYDYHIDNGLRYTWVEPKFG